MTSISVRWWQMVACQHTFVALKPTKSSIPTPVHSELCWVGTYAFEIFRFPQFSKVIQLAVFVRMCPTQWRHVSVASDNFGIHLGRIEGILFLASGANRSCMYEDISTFSTTMAIFRKRRGRQRAAVSAPVDDSASPQIQKAPNDAGGKRKKLWFSQKPASKKQRQAVDQVEKPNSITIVLKEEKQVESIASGDSTVIVDDDMSYSLPFTATMESMSIAQQTFAQNVLWSGRIRRD